MGGGGGDGGGGGLGLRSLAHSPAAYLASLIKAGSLIPSDEYALESFSILNSIVPPVHAIFCFILAIAKRISWLGWKITSLISCYFSRSLLTMHIFCLCPHAMLHPGYQPFLQWVLTCTLNLMSSRLH